MKVVCFLLIVMISPILNGAEFVDVTSKFMTVSREAVSAPSVSILDDVMIHYFTESKVIASVTLSEDEIKSLNGNGDLDPEMEPAVSDC